MTYHSVKDSPFYRLKLTPRSTREEIIERADELCLLRNMDTEAHTDALLHPAKRIACEVSWLPDAPIDTVIAVAEYAGEGLYPDVEGLAPLAKFNACAELLLNTVFPGMQTAISACLSLAGLYNEIDPAELRETIDRDRASAGFPATRDVDEVSDALDARCRAVAHELERMLWYECERNGGGSAYDRAVRKLATAYAEDDAATRLSPLLEHIAEEHHMTVGGSIAACEERFMRAAEGEADYAEACSALDGWHELSRPIRTVYRAKGLEHPDAARVSDAAHSYMIGLHNKQKKTEASAHLLLKLRKIFTDLPAFVGRLDNDRATIEGTGTAALKGDDERGALIAKREELIAFAHDRGAAYCGRCDGKGVLPEYAHKKPMLRGNLKFCIVDDDGCTVPACPDCDGSGLVRGWVR